jgi:hypothetical protein
MEPTCDLEKRMARTTVYGRADKDRFEGDLKAFAEIPENQGKPLKITDYTEWARQHKRTSADVLRRCYGSWEEAVASISAKAIKSKSLTDKELLQYYLDCWEWNSEGTFSVDLAPTQGVIEAYNKKTRKAISIYYYTKRGWTWSELKADMNLVVSGLKTLDQIVDAKGIEIDKPVSPRMRAMILKRDNSTCQMCGAMAVSGSTITLHVHHKFPRSKGGSSTDPENLETLCSECNQGLGDLEFS